MTHAALIRINPKGIEGVWRCTRCKAEGTFSALEKVVCTRPGPATDKELIGAIKGEMN